MEINLPKMHLTWFEYQGLTIQAGGCLPNEKAAHACWYFYTIAQTAKESIGDTLEHQMIYDENLWMDKRYVQQAMAVSILYGLDSPDEFARFWPYVMKQTEQLGLPFPAEEYVRLTPRGVITSTPKIIIN